MKKHPNTESVSEKRNDFLLKKKFYIFFSNFCLFLGSFFFIINNWRLLIGWLCWSANQKPPPKWQKHDLIIEFFLKMPVTYVTTGSLRVTIFFIQTNSTYNHKKRILLTPPHIWNMFHEYTFSSNNNIHKSSYGLCFWGSDPLIERFY